MKNKNIVGVVIGRFQTPYIHRGHKYLINSAMESSEKLLLVIGVTDCSAGQADPMDFETRAAMLKSAYPEAQISMIKDNPSDKIWSEQLDKLIEGHFPGYEAILFGSRHSFIPFYHGKCRTKEIEALGKISATDLRNGIVKAIDSEDFRAGMIYASKKQFFPTSFQTVDVVIRHGLEDKVIVGRKANEDKWRFPGGFVDPADQSLERAAKREAVEEVGDIEIVDIEYVQSVRIPDHRYRRSEHKVMTALFSGIYIFGHIKAGDDLAEVRWQSIDGLVDCLIEDHKPLGIAYLKKIQKQ